ncbi:cytochrome P450 [Aspergillus pseudotamarii]|uniref:Cytochrome P450 n=1 Tax=Aspergillus pseudotamarii TaxID=132259 RepID=A0A5N6SI65_ASPPS|nr:cytochrome P450 [Aspergillus pseudotamarii]KAE8133597.1 cytochrome P450 [Aspergillus pseudotamarii]
MGSSLLLVAISLGTICIFVYTLSYPRRQLPLPPGPRRLPLIGNLHQLDIKRPWESFHKWHQQYGPLVAVKFGARTIVSISSDGLARDLLNKRCATYSSRPRLSVCSENNAGELHAALMPHSKRWVLHHRIALTLLNPGLSKQYRQLQDLESQRVIHELLQGNDVAHSFDRYMASVSFTLAYGLPVQHHNQREVLQIRNFINGLRDAMSNMFVAVAEIFPLLDQLPGAFAIWRRQGEELNRHATAFFLDNSMKAQSAPGWNWVRECERLKETQDMSLREIAHVLGTIQEAGMETTPSVFRVVIKACLLYPACLSRAQEEIDEVVGRSRLPSFDDMGRLPYINALIHEAARWQPITPLGLPHCPLRDDEFMGYHIPAGSTIFPNNHSMVNDPEAFPEPREFKPERWLQSQDPPFSPFGYGRRICPGRHHALDSLFIVISRVVWAYTITHAYRNGEKVDVDAWDTHTSFTSSPAPFPTVLRVRSQTHQEIIEEAWTSTKEKLANFLGTFNPTSGG